MAGTNAGGYDRALALPGHFFAWTDIRGFFTEPTYLGGQVRWRFVDGYQARDHLPSLAARFTAYKALLPDTYNYQADQLAALLEEWRLQTMPLPAAPPPDPPLPPNWHSRILYKACWNWDVGSAGFRATWRRRTYASPGWISHLWRLPRRRRELLVKMRPEFLVGDVTRLDTLDGPFDASFDVGCFHCLDSSGQRAYAAEVSRLLRPGGTHLIWALARPPSGLPLTPVVIREVFGPHFELRAERKSRRRLVPSHWFWLARSLDHGQ